MPPNETQHSLLQFAFKSSHQPCKMLQLLHHLIFFCAPTLCVQNNVFFSAFKKKRREKKSARDSIKPDRERDGRCRDVYEESKAAADESHQPLVQKRDVIRDWLFGLLNSVISTEGFFQQWKVSSTPTRWTESARVTWRKCCCDAYIDGYFVEALFDVTRGSGSTEKC
jgi:hypothetical protein